MTKKGGGPLRQQGSVKLSPAKPTSTSADHRARVINMTRSIAATTKTTGDSNYKFPSRRSIKKAHVRFDDYLDLNEENMRRSCKRLMNRLYHASPSSDSQPSVVDAACSMSVATKSTCRPISPPPLLVQVNDENDQIASQSATTMSPGATNQNRIIADNITSSHTVIASSMFSELPPTNGKSYLRSQYERRQKRQIALMHQQQQQNQGETMATKLNLTAADARSCNQNDNNEVTSVDGPGANNNICRQHQQRLHQEQQDLVAKSHELSKRRFFEKLERRESMKKNSTQASTQDERQPQLSSGARAFKQVQQSQPPQPPSSDHRRKKQQMFTAKANHVKENLASGENEKSMIFREPVKHRELIARGGGGGSGMGNKSCTADAQSDEQLMLKVYQSMVAAGAGHSPGQYCGDMTAARVVCVNAQLNLPSRTSGGPPPKLPPASTQPSLYGCVRSDLLATELIGLHTSTSQQQVPDEAAATAGKSLNESQRTDLGVPCLAVSGDEHLLIEFSKGKQRHSPDTSALFSSSAQSEPTDSSCSGTMQRQCTSEAYDNSAFEIKVPADLSGSLDQVNSSSCFIDRLLIVKQVESDNDQCESRQAPSLVSGCNNEKSIEVDQRRATSKSTTQLEGNKASINLMAAVSSSSLPDNEINNSKQQIKESAAQVSTSLPDGLATIEEEAAGDGVSDARKVTSNSSSAAKAADAVTDSDEAAASLETIITNKRDVPPEANAVTRLLTLQQTNNARRFSKPTPLNYCDMQHNKQPKVSSDSSSEVDREIDNERAQPVGQVAALELKEIAKVDQGGSLEQHQPAVEDEHEKREQALSAVAAGYKEQEQYANPSPDQSTIAAAAVASSKENNHDPSATEEASLNPSQERARMQPPPAHCENVVGIDLISDGDFMGKHQHSIEPSHKLESPISALERVNVARSERFVSSSSSIDPTAEEDIGSSCSSSGFGASVSATSTASSSDDRRSHHHKSFKDEKLPTFGAYEGHYRRPNSMPQNSLYESLRAVSRTCDKNSSVLAQQTDQLQYQQVVVGPDQAYPGSRTERPMLVENYGYASLTGRYRFSTPLPELPPRTDAGHAAAPAKTNEPPEPDLYSTVLYANLPESIRMQRSPIVEHATATVASRNGEPANIPPAENKRYSASSRNADRHHHLGQSSSTESQQTQRSDDCESSLSGSANSGGFSMLPPVRLIDPNFANNSDFSKSLEPSLSIYGESTATSQHSQQEPAKKSVSLFKRFGSLVSKAFTSTSVTVGGNDCGGGSVQFNKDSTMTPFSLSNESQSLSLHVNTQKCTPPSRMHERLSATTIARREHKSGGAAKDSSNRNYKDTLYANANVVRYTTTTATATATRAAGGRVNKKTPLAIAEADLVILPTKHSKDDQQRKNDTYAGGATLRHSHKNITAAAELPKDCNRAKKKEKPLTRGKQSSRDVCELKHSRRMLCLSPRSTSISIASSYSSSSLDCSSSSERYGPTSLIDQSHANSDMRLNDCPRGRARSRHYARLNGGRKIGSTYDTTRGEPSCMLYATLHQSRSLQMTNEPRPRDGSWPKLASDEDTSSENEAVGASAERSNDLVVNEAKCRSLNLYQNLLRNYVKRRHHRHHHHGHNRGHQHHHHHNHQHAFTHHHKHSSSARHAHCSSTTRCGQQCLAVTAGARVCSSLSEQSSNSKNQSSIGGGGGTTNKKTTHGDKASVWGQLIKINKLDGSQVIELQRAPSRSWGFFVARGAINNMKGIFISRVHDNATGTSLTGLLGIGDRILSIDNCAIEPDDILRVNQMISKKNKILLRVKPFK